MGSLRTLAAVGSACTDEGLASKLREYEDRQEIEEEPVERLPSRSNFFSTEEENELASQGFQGGKGGRTSTSPNDRLEEVASAPGEDIEPAAPEGRGMWKMGAVAAAIVPMVAIFVRRLLVRA